MRLYSFFFQFIFFLLFRLYNFYCHIFQVSDSFICPSHSAMELNWALFAEIFYFCIEAFYFFHLLQACSLFFLSLDLGYRFLGRKTRGVKCHSYPIQSRVHTINMIYLCWCRPWLCGLHSVCQCSPLLSCFLFSCFLYCILCKAVTTGSSQLKVGSYVPPPWWGVEGESICITYLEFCECAKHFNFNVS